MMNDTVDQLKQDDPQPAVDLSDEDLRQLVIHYATIVRNPKSNVSASEVTNVWNEWPKDLWERFSKMILDEGSPAFWCRPADTNIKYGLDYVAPDASVVTQ